MRCPAWVTARTRYNKRGASKIDVVQICRRGVDNTRGREPSDPESRRRSPRPKKTSPKAREDAVLGCARSTWKKDGRSDATIVAYTGSLREMLDGSHPIKLHLAGGVHAKKDGVVHA